MIFKKLPLSFLLFWNMFKVNIFRNRSPNNCFFCFPSLSLPFFSPRSDTSFWVTPIYDSRFQKTGKCFQPVYLGLKHFCFSKNYPLKWESKWEGGRENGKSTKSGKEMLVLQQSLKNFSLYFQWKFLQTKSGFLHKQQENHFFFRCFFHHKETKKKLRFPIFGYGHVYKEWRVKEKKGIDSGRERKLNE